MSIDLLACYSIFKLVSGAPATIVTPDMLPEPYCAGAIAIINSNGRGRPIAYTAWLDTLDKSLAEEVRHAHRAWQANGQPSEPPKPKTLTPDQPCPELHRDAQLTPQMERAAQSVGGYLDEYIKFATRAAPMTPREFHQAFGLAAISTAIARRVSFKVSTTEHFTNLYLLLTAESTLYAKSTGFDVFNQVITAADMYRFTLPPRQTPESLLLELSERAPATLQEWSQEDQDMWRKERTFAAQRVWAIDECSYLFDMFERDSTSGLLTILLDLYGCPRGRSVNTIMRGRQSVNLAYITFVGATTPAQIAPHLESKKNWQNGLWARFSLIIPSEIPEWKFWPPAFDCPACAVDPLKHLAYDKLPVPKTVDERRSDDPVADPMSVELSPGVWDAWEAYSKATRHSMLRSGTVDHQVWSSYGRISIHAMKVAMLLAVMDWSDTKTVKFPKVTLGHWARGQMIAEEWRASLHRMIEAPDIGNESNQDERKVMKTIASRDKGEGLTNREIGQYAHLSRETVDLVVGRLMLDGMVKKCTSRKVPTVMLP